MTHLSTDDEGSGAEPAVGWICHRKNPAQRSFAWAYRRRGDRGHLTQVRRAHHASAGVSFGADPQSVPTPCGTDVIDAYLYLLSRLLVLRQEHLDFEQGGFRWNEVIHREPGGSATVNPNLDVAYSEAWVAVDETSSTIVDVPEIAGRYFTVQALNPWGETIVNLNERTYPKHPFGSFAFCSNDSLVDLPEGALRVELPGKKARVLVRVELGSDPAEASALQRRITLHATGTPKIDEPVAIPSFTNQDLPGAEVFDSALDVLASEPDINPGVAAVQANVRSVAAAVAGSATERRRVESLIRDHGTAAVHREVVRMGTLGNGWVHRKSAGNYGADWRLRLAANYAGLWADSPSEVACFGAGTAKPLNGSDTYTMTFVRDDLPSFHVKYFWSVTCTGAVDRHVIPNPRNRFFLNQQSELQFGSGGSLTLYFAPRKPAEAPDGNWLPTAMGKNFALTWRSYGPDKATTSGKWFPPRLERRAV